MISAPSTLASTITDHVFCPRTDIKTLGGAGFASQSHTSSYDLSHFNGLGITLQPTSRRDCTTFTITLKTELPRKRKDGRNESVMNYEWDFDASDTMMTNMQDEKEVNQEKMEEGTMMGAKNKTFKAEWKDFKATYRGRPVDPHEAKPLNPADIKEISIMCRSNVSVSCITHQHTRFLATLARLTCHGKVGS